ncbi:MAG: GNAT family N-acetyltransferase [Clostridiales bacterium]|nr:GNAT family N-acetyltransferase [Clostridiales bacterium]
MADMLVRLLDLPEADSLLQKLEMENIQIRRAIAPDKFRVVNWVKEHSSISGAGECDVCFSHTPVSCFIATEGAKIIGFACYNATAPDFFGPTRVLEDYRGRDIGKALLLRSLHALRDEGYIYAIIGGIGPQIFYEKCVGATLIEHSTPGIYKDFIGALEKK